jgi:hypothetical protein
MDWIRKNLFFDRKNSNKRSEENEKDAVIDDEFIDIVEGLESSAISSVTSESPATSDHEEKVKTTPAAVNKVARKPSSHQIFRLSQAAPISESNPEDVVQFAPPQRPKNGKKKVVSNGQLQVQGNIQLQNNIIHQPR